MSFHQLTDGPGDPSHAFGFNANEMQRHRDLGSIDGIARRAGTTDRTAQRHPSN